MTDYSGPRRDDAGCRRGGGARPAGGPSPALLIGILVVAFGLPTAVVVYDIYRDRTSVEVGDFSPDGLDGLWRVRCGHLRGALVEVSSSHPLSAVGMVRALGRGARHGYQFGDEILHLDIGADGHWRGRILWRERRRPPRWRAMAIRAEQRRTFGLSQRPRCFEHLDRPG
ncbi:MAG: hypothetical protein ABI333_13895 [bacterium]